MATLAQNLQTCWKCRAARGIVDPPMSKRLCPEDGETCLSNAQKGKCDLGLLSEPAAVVATTSPRQAHGNQAPETPTSGPGTELKKMLATMGIVAGATCQCRKMAARMDVEGPRWCLENINIVVDVMRKESERRGLPFLTPIAHMMVRRAVRKAATPTPPPGPSSHRAQLPA